MKKLMFIAFAFMLFFSCKRPAELLNDTTAWSDYRTPLLARVSVYDTLPKKALKQVSIREIHGIKATYPSGKYTSYFEYEADPDKLLLAVQTIPFSMYDVGDTLCRDMRQTFSLSGQRVLTVEEKKAASFFWNIDPAEFTYYECLKGHQRHTILISKLSSRILHRIETTV